VFANPVAPPRVLPQRDILRFLRLITSPAYRREPERLPLSVVAAMCGVSRLALAAGRTGISWRFHYRLRLTG
jgi:hypothetical protein